MCFFDLVGALLAAPAFEVVFDFVAAACFFRRAYLTLPSYSAVASTRHAEINVSDRPHAPAPHRHSPSNSDLREKSHKPESPPHPRAKSPSQTTPCRSPAIIRPTQCETTDHSSKCSNNADPAALRRSPRRPHGNFRRIADTPPRPGAPSPHPPSPLA